MSTPDSAVDAVAHWENVFATGMHGSYSDLRPPGPGDPVIPALHEALRHFGEVQGKTVLDLGSGRGGSSLFLADQDANVLAVDFSRAACERLQGYCTEHGIRNVTPVCLPALEIAQLGPVDFVSGSMILHHIEPFGGLVQVLREVLSDGGKAFFYENNAASDLLLWFRQNVAGRFGAPKFGDADEFPLTEKEVELLRNHFRVEVVYPELFFFRMIPPYLLKGHFEGPFAALDRFLFRIPAFRRFTYRQFLYLS